MTAGLVLFAISGGLGALSWWLIRELAGKQKEIRELNRQNIRLKDAIKDRDKAIHEMQEAYHEADKKKKSTRSGDDSLDFQRSVDLLRDVPREPGAD